jgi:ketosteroid isomerase-like protein
MMMNKFTLTMKKFTATATLLTTLTCFVFAQKAPLAKVQTVVTAEESFNKLVAKKGIKEAFLSVGDPEGIVFKPDAQKITDFYGAIDKQPGSLTWKPKFARISAAGDLAFTAGPYIYQNGKSDDDKVYGDYVSVWHADGDGNLKLLIDLGIQHPEPEAEVNTDFSEPDTIGRGAPSKDPFGGKRVIIETDKMFNHALTISTLGTYKEFLSPEGRYYFPGFEPITGVDKTLKFLANEAVNISAETVNAGRSISNDLAYSYGTARIKKGNIVSSYNYVRIWELDKQHKWNVLLEVFSAVEK